MGYRTHRGMTFKSTPQEVLYNLDINTTERVMDLLKEFQLLSFDEYREELDCLVNSLLSIPFEYIPPVQERNEIVEMITEEFYRMFGEFPRQDVLSKLGDFILLDYIKSRSKSKFDDNVFHTQKQTKRRMARESMTEADTMDFLNCRMNLNMSSLHKKTKKAVE